jgi:23S rRNA pseudouridine1911/1915/1917 synthase
VYGKKKQTIVLNRHFLHALRLKIILPGEKEPQLFEAGLPEELDAVLNTLRGEE